MTGHPVAEVPPEAGIPGDNQLIRLRWHLTTLEGVHDVRIVQAEDNGIVDFASRGGVPSAPATEYGTTVHKMYTPLGLTPLEVSPDTPMCIQEEPRQREKQAGAAPRGRSAT